MMESPTDITAGTLKATMNRHRSNSTFHIRRRSSIIVTISLLSLVSTTSALWGEKRLLARYQPLYQSRSLKHYCPSHQIISRSDAIDTDENYSIINSLRGGGDEAINESSIEDISNNDEGGNDVPENALESTIVVESSVVETNDEVSNEEVAENSAGDEIIQEDDSNEEVEEEISIDDNIDNDDISSVDEVNESTILSDEADVLENDLNSVEQNESIDEKSAEDDEEGTEYTASENVDENDTSNTSILESESSNDDDEYDEDSTDEAITTPSLDEYEIQSNELRTSASDKRALAKTHHDDGNLKDAAVAFREAAVLLDEAMDALSQSTSVNENTMTEEEEGIAVERATCRLHEALCLLKDGRPGDCVEACTDVLEDDVTVVPLADDNKNSDNDSDDNLEQPKQAAVVKIIPATTATTTKKVTIPAQIRARAHHRRAKARLALGDLDGALEDARSAAFMGDRNAVQFYGRLMREGSATAGGELSSSPSLPMGMGSGSNPFLDGMLGGMGGTTNPFMPSPGAAPSSDFSSSLLSSLLTGNSGSDSGTANPFGLFGELLSPPDEGKGSKRRRSKKKKGGMDNLAKSVIKNVMKRIEDKNTQETICGYLQSTNKQQIMQLSTMAGVPMKEESAQRLAGIANGITPRGIRKGLRRVKRGLKVIKTGRKILKVIDKYKPLIIVGVILYWTRSALLAPYPVSKKKLAQQAAFGLLIMPAHRNGVDKIVRSTLNKFFMTSTESDADRVEDESSGIEEEIEKLQQQLTLIEALEERNKAQIESFIDEDDQWNSMEEWEQELLSSKEQLTQQMEQLTEELVLMFMGEKARNG